VDLHQHWAETERQLRAARAELSAVPHQGPSLGTDDRYQEYLDANELQLALEELEGLGEQNEASPVFWNMLRIAAERMQLSEHAVRYARRATT
jgi:hypothetical protein